MTALYPPIIAMLLGLVFRGVAFEARWRDPAHRRWWDVAFTTGSIVAAFAQGVTLGALLQGVRVAGRVYGGGWLDWLTPFSLLTGVSTICGYALLGATWLIWKTEGGTQNHAFRLAGRFGIATLVAIAAVSLATLTLDYDYRSRWLDYPQIMLTAQVPLLVAILAFAFYRALVKRREVMPFFLALGLFLMSFVGLGISMYPYIVPQALTIWQAAAPEKSQWFHAGRCGGADPDHHRLHRLCLLGIPREGGRAWLSLMPPPDRRAGDRAGDRAIGVPLWRRLAWLVAIWAASVAALGVVAYAIRWWLVP